MQDINNPQKTIVWRFLDGKVGHEKQSRALVEGLKSLRTIECIDIPVQRSSFYFFLHWLFNLKIDLYSKYKTPNLLIGTGHNTHLAILASQRYFNCKSLVIMSPSLPHQLFDVIVAPRHDYFNKTVPKNVVLTPTAISPAIESRPNNKQGLILLGGDSQHYHWNDDKVIEAIKQLIKTKPDTILWQLTTSRRTPKSTFERLLVECNKIDSIKILKHEDLAKNWLSESLQTAGHIGITPDSVSMISEALMTDAFVTLLEIEPKNPNGKIVKANHYLNEEGYLRNNKNTRSKKKKIDNKQTTKKIVDLLEL